MITQIRLIPLDVAAIAEILDDLEQFEAHSGISAETNRTVLIEVARQTGEMLRVGGVQPPWCGYLAVNQATRMLVGTCGFKGAPTEEGIVEIAYFTFPEGERRGYATEMAYSLTAIARGSSQVRKIVAHTQPERGASTRVLEKIGMYLEGEVTDPEDGRVWRWELSL